MTARPVALVTGATGGMGVEIVRDLARDHDVVALGRSAARLAGLAELPGVVTHAVDLLDFTALQSIVAGLDRLDVLVQAAAVADRYGVEQASPEVWRAQLDLNVVAPAELTRLALPLLRAARGQVVFINSGAGFRAFAGHAVYSASKFALRALADALRAEEAERGVRVSSVHPGPTDTGMLRGDFEAHGWAYEPERYIRPRSVAEAVRLVVDATEDTQITSVSVRPRVELA